MTESKLTRRGKNSRQKQTDKQAETITHTVFEIKKRKYMSGTKINERQTEIVKKIIIIIIKRKLTITNWC